MLLTEETWPRPATIVSVARVLEDTPNQAIVSTLLAKASLEWLMGRGAARLIGSKESILQTQTRTLGRAFLAKFEGQRLGLCLYH